MESNYFVQIEDFAERHFIKSFKKKHKAHWDVTLIAIIAEFERIDNLLLTDKADTIINNEEVKMIKTEFRVSGTKESARSSGNRCIVAWNKDKKFVAVLLVYHKSHLSGRNETAEWKKIIKDNYSEYKHLF